MTIWTTPEHKEWDDLALRTVPFVDKLTHRSDIAVMVHPDPADFSVDQEAPGGWWIPSLAQLNLNAKKLFSPTLETVAHINPASVISQRKHPLFIACTVHEASHARHSTYKTPVTMHPLTRELMKALEEPRCEVGTLKEFPQYIPYLKTLIIEVVAEDFFAGEEIPVNGKQPLTERFQAVHLGILLIGRQLNGVFLEAELVKAHEMIHQILGANDYHSFIQLLIEALTIADDNPDALVEIAEKLRKIVDPAGLADKQREIRIMVLPCGSSMPSDEDDESSEGGDPTEGDESGEGSGIAAGSDDDASSDKDDNDQNADEGSGTGEPDMGTPKPKPAGFGKALFAPVFREMAENKEKAEKKIANMGAPVSVPMRDKNAENAAHRALQKKEADKVDKGKGYGGGWGVTRPVIRLTNPKDIDVSRSRALSNAIGKAQFRGIHQTTLRSQVPPGRLNIRGAMNRQAQVAARSELTATPWTVTRRREVDSPPITLAIASDISGSMNVYQQEVSSFTWAFNTAIKRLQGKCGAVAWNSGVWNLLDPNRVHDTIPVAETCGGSDGLPSAIAALDTMMDLSFGTGVRVLAIITDSDLYNGAEIQQQIDSIVAYGVKILWISTDSDMQFTPKNVTIAVLDSPADFGRIVGAKTIEMLSQA